VTSARKEVRPVWKRLVLLWRVLRGDARRLWFALRHPAAPIWLKVGTAVIVLYVLSPIDLIPDAIPIVGWIDDIVIASFAIRFMLARLPAHVRGDADRRAG
jgi:uncharacterized membrane protein YkvA (DUF1232 family)